MKGAGLHSEGCTYIYIYIVQTSTFKGANLSSLHLYGCKLAFGEQDYPLNERILVLWHLGGANFATLFLCVYCNNTHHRIPTEYNYFTCRPTCLILVHVLSFQLSSSGCCYIFYIIQWNLVIKRSDITKPSYKQGNFAGPSSLYFFVFVPWYNEKPDITRSFSWSRGPRYNEVPLYSPCSYSNL